MNGYRLLVDWAVIEKVDGLPLPIRRVIKNVFVRIGRFPDRMSDYMEPNDRGIDLSVHLSHGFAIKYWTDFADRHIKILDIVAADQT